ncbi:unnamed protein product [Prunus armeniaca]
MMELLIILLKYLEWIERKQRRKEKRKRYLLYFPSLFFIIFPPLSLFNHSLSVLFFFPLSLSLLPSSSYFILFPSSFFPSLFFNSFSSLSFFVLQLPPPKLLLLLHGVTSMAAKGKNQSLPLNSRSAVGSSDPIDPMVDPPLLKVVE